VSFTCSRCGAEHPGPPMAYSSTAPGRWYTLTDDEKAASRLDGELCVVAGSEFFVRANLAIPVEGSGEALTFSAWVQVDAGSLSLMLDRWDHPDRALDAAYSGVLANDIAGYPETIGLAVEVQTDEPGTRARAVPLPSDHPLSVDHWEGINPAQVRSLAELLAHPEG